MTLSAEQEQEIAALREQAVADPARRGAGARGDPVPAAAGARPRLRAGDRLHGRRRCDRAGGAGVLRARHQEGQRRPRADQLPDAHAAHLAVRDVRAEAAREAADLRRAAVDPPPHRQRQRVLGALLGARGRVLRAGAGAPRGPVERQPAGPRRGARRPAGGRRAGTIADQCRARLRATISALLNQDERRRSRSIPSAPGLARELARMVLPLNTYTEWYWKTDLHNLLHFIALRADPHAQYEIRAYAEVLLDVVRRWVPLTCAAFEDYRLHARRALGQGARGAAPDARGRAGRRRRTAASARASGASCRRICSRTEPSEMLARHALI